ncbi:MAG: tyrosine-type recombinase/integrase [Candidatus Atribacteria bacterium]|nr:tyrosine-type recombinase/integrase [Candidatus Atribacteria bacterium]
MEISDIQFVQFLKNKGICTGKADNEAYKNYLWFKNGLSTFITSYYDEREETEKDVWIAVNIPGARLSAAERSGTKRSLSFHDIPKYYREMTKRFLRRLVTRRSWSYCSEMLMYIRYFFNSFYQHNYDDGFLKRLSREDVEKYLLWVADNYHDRNATYRSKAVSFIQAFLWYIQLAQYLEAPKTEVEKLIYGDDYPRRERVVDTMQKVRYIPAPVKEQLDAALYELEPAEMIPIYILLRETGWRGTDILNIRYENCLDYQWNAVEGRYVIYLCGEITKTGIPVHKIPIRSEVGEMVKKIADNASQKSTVANNPDGYLFNTYEGRNMKMPLSKSAFVKAVKKLIEMKCIHDAEGKIYHFRTHSMRHTRAMEYAEQGMSIGIIQQILGHCSLQMTLHYAKVTENALYEKWKETEKLNLFHLKDSHHTEKVGTGQEQEESVVYESVRKNLDAVRVPFGTCFKPSKITCRQQMRHCLECSSFCSTSENILEFEEEIKRVLELIDISHKNGREDWEKKNTEYLNILEKMLERIRNEGIVHKNGSLREER